MNLALEIARQTMMQAQTGMSVAMNNIANSKVEGYTRQKVALVTGISIGQGGHLLGTGASISSIDRVRSGFYDRQLRENLGILNHSSTMATSLGRIETFFGFLDGDTGLKTSLEGFFGSLEELSKNPEKIGVKQVVKDSAIALADAFNLIANNLKTMNGQYTSNVESMVTDINNTLTAYQQINDEIGRIVASGQNPNDLLDERDRMIDKLSSYMDISALPAENGMVNLVSNGQVLAQSGFSTALTFTSNADGSVGITYPNGEEFKSNGGELKALVSTVNDVIPEYQDKIDLMAKDFMDAFNKVHKSGVLSDGTKGGAFFEGDSAGTIKVSEAIQKDPSLIVTSSDGATGNNDIILELINVKDAKVIDGGKFGVLEYFDNVAANISARTASEKTKADNYGKISAELYIMRANESGVNEDEELITSVTLQQTFAAASKIVSTLNEMFSSLINAI